MLYISIYFSFWSPVKLAGSNQCPFLFLSATWQHGNLSIYIYIWCILMYTHQIYVWTWPHPCHNKQPISKSLIPARSPGCQAFQRCGTQQLITSILLFVAIPDQFGGNSSQPSFSWFVDCVHICIHWHVYNLKCIIYNLKKWNRYMHICTWSIYISSIYIYIRTSICIMYYTSIYIMYTIHMSFLPAFGCSFLWNFIKVVLHSNWVYH